MTTWIDPSFLSLTAVGVAAGQSQGDLSEGRHLRWFFGAPLGFPRSGFRLHRRSSAALLDWSHPPAGSPIVAQATSRTELGTGATMRFDNGLTVSKPGGFVFDNILQGSAPLLRIDARITALDFGAVGSNVPAGSALLSNPAVFVRLTVMRRKRTGTLRATAYYDAHGSYVFQDRASLAARRFPGAADAAIPDDLVLANDRRANEALTATGRRPHPVFGRDLGGTDPWVTESVLLRGSFLEHLELEGANAVLVSVQWITARAYVNQPGWTDIGAYYVPLTDAAPAYPAWTTQAASSVAADRLGLSPPMRLLPWDDQQRTVAENLKQRYLEVALPELQSALRLVLKSELDQGVPQSTIEIREALQPDDPASRGFEATMRPFEHVYAAAADPQVARMLGLMTTDLDDPTGVYDYYVDAGFPSRWIHAALSLDKPIASPGEILDRPDRCIAFAAAVARRASASPLPPPDLSASFVPDPVKRPIAGRVELEFRADAGNHFENDGRRSVFYALARTDSQGDVLLHHQDDETKLIAPHLPTLHAATGKLRLVDRSLREWGSTTWHLRGMDLWGRVSDEATVTLDVRDLVAPPAPTELQVSLEGPAANAPEWSDLAVRFAWTAAQEALAPDLASFEVHGATSTPIVLRWSDLTITPAAPPTISATSTPRDAALGGGYDVEMHISPVVAAFGPEGVASLPITVRALDVHGNAGPLTAPALARRMRESAPPAPAFAGDIAIATRADASGFSWYRITWPDLGPGSARVLRASARSLLIAANADMVSFEALDRAGRANALRGWAVAHPEVFSADHEHPYPAPLREHLARLLGSAREFTLFMIEHTTETHIRASWPSDPTRFMVIATPSDAAPRPPFVREVRAGDRRVALVVDPDPEGVDRELRFFRAKSQAELDDVRRMREVERRPSAAGETVFVDESVYPDVDYWYRVIAVRADGTQSAASAPSLARPFSSMPPDPPSLTSVTRAAALRRAIACEVARRDWPLQLFRRKRGTPDWQSARGPNIGPAGRIDVAALTPSWTGTGYRLDLEDEVPADPLDASDLSTKYVYRLRVVDPRGRAADSDDVEQTP